MKKLFRATNFAMSILSFGFLVLNSLLCTPSLCSENRLSYVDNGEQLDFYLQDGNFSIMKDGVTYKQIPLNKDYKFMSSNTPSLSLNAIAVPAFMVAGGLLAGGMIAEEVAATAIITGAASHITAVKSASASVLAVSLPALPTGMVFGLTTIAGIGLA